MTTQVICLRLKSLAVYIQYYLDHFIFQINFDASTEKTESLRSGLSSILRRIIRLISHFPNISDYIYRTYSTDCDTPSSEDGYSHGFLHFPDIYPGVLKSNTDPKQCDTAFALLFIFTRFL